MAKRKTTTRKRQRAQQAPENQMAKETQNASDGSYISVSGCSVAVNPPAANEHSAANVNALATAVIECAKAVQAIAKSAGSPPVEMGQGFSFNTGK